MQAPASPRLLGKASVGDEIFDLWVVGPQVYLATRVGLVIVDVRDPSHTVQQGALQYIGSASSVLKTMIDTANILDLLHPPLT